MVKQDQARVMRIARLLERAAARHNESADATGSIAVCFESDGELNDEMFDRVFDAVTELACASMEKTPNYRRAARELIARVTRVRQELQR